MQVSIEDSEEKSKKKLPTAGFKGKGIEISYNKTHQAEQQHWKRLYLVQQKDQKSHFYIHSSKSILKNSVACKEDTFR